MQLKTIPLYRFDELEEDIQNELVEQVADKHCRNFDDYPIIEGFIEDMEKYGLSNVDVNWSGFGSQGDGACFTAHIDFIKCCDILFKYNKDFTPRELQRAYHVDADVVRCGYSAHYAHDKTCEVGLSSPNWDDMSKAQQAQLEKLEKELTEWVRSECRAFYDKIEKYYFEQQDAGVIAEDLNELGEIYTETGQIIDLD